jgi:hypothetical protein
MAVVIVACTAPDSTATNVNSGTVQHEAILFPSQEGTMWAPYLEWSLNNSSYTGNPFDVIANVTFVHDESGTTHQTQMFYDGNDTWRFRFTGTQLGQWSFTTSSSDHDLHGHIGTVIIGPNPDPQVTGFLTLQGNKFAIQNSNNQLQGQVFNVYMNLVQVDQNIYDYEDQSILEQMLQETRQNGSSSIFVLVANYWFNFGTLAHNQHNSEDPDPRTFRMLENMITTAHAQGLNIHIWAWGDEDRRWTPIGVGGINGIPDKRLQRYIAARLGPLPGWTMSYGFDLFEWVSASQTAEWADYMHEHLGWEHLLMAREEASFLTPDNMDVFSTDERVTSDFYDNALNLLNNSPNRPVLYERRFAHMRDDVWTMENTRRAMWQFTMAGGTGGFWGFFSNSPSPYPNPEQLRTHRDFWQNRFLLDMAPANELTDAYAMKSEINHCYVFYQEDTSSIQMNLSGMVGPQPAVAVDTRLAYAEIDLGILAPTNQTWNAPYQSDWAIAVGNFDRQAAAASGFQAEPLNLSNNPCLPLITSGIAADTCGY